MMYEVLCLSGISLCEHTYYRVSVLGSAGVSLCVYLSLHFLKQLFDPVS